MKVHGSKRRADRRPPKPSSMHLTENMCQMHI